MQFPAEPTTWASGYLPYVWGLVALVVGALLAVLVAAKGRL